jgi:RHS repeat-associated protein
VSDTTATYDPLGEELTSSAIDGTLTRTTSYTRDWRGLATSVTDPAGNVTYRVYDDAGQLVSTISPTVSTTTVSTATGTAVATQVNAQAVVTAGYDTFGETVEKVDADGHEVRTGYDADGNKIYEEDPSYNRPDPGAGAASVTPVSVYQYDPDGELIHSWDPVATGSEAVSAGALPLNTAGYTAGDESSVTYNNLGLAISQSQTDLSGKLSPSTIKATATYDAVGDRLNSSDPDNAQTITDYDYLGRVTYQTTYETKGGPDNKTPEYDTVAYTYGTTPYQTSNTAGFATEQTVQTASTLSASQSTAATVLASAFRTYDSAGEVSAQIVPVDTASSSDIAVESYAYDGAGRVVKTTAPNGSYTTANYDEAGLQTGSASYDSAGAVIASGSATYDTDGRTSTSTALEQTAAQSPTGTATYATSCFSYDATGLLKNEIQPVTAASNPSATCNDYVTTGSNANAIEVSYRYDADGNKTAYTDGNGNTSYTTYNSLGLAEATIAPSVSTAAYSYTSLSDAQTVDTYNADGEITAQQQPGGVTRTTDYDAFGRVADENGSIAGTTGSTGTTASAERTFTYGNDGEVSSASTSASGASSGTSEIFSYNDRGELLTATGAAGNSTFTYNGAGQMASRNDASGTSTYGYTDGLLTSDTDAASGAQLQYSYYPTTGQLKTIAYSGAGGDTRTFGYDAAGHLASDALASGTGAAVRTLTYAYNAAGELTTKQDATGTANAYTYDEAGRLTSWTKGSSTAAYSGTGTCTNSSTLTCYAYDADSNRTEVGSNVYTYDARDQLTSDGTNTYTYTANGEVSQISKSTANGPVVTSYTDDAYGQQSSAGAASYTYDATGRVVSESVGATTSTMQYSGTGNDVAQVDGQIYSRDPGGALVGENTAVATTASPTSSATGTTASSPGMLLWSDLHTDVVAAFGASGTSLSGTQEYDPLGNVLTTTGAMQGIALGYQGEFTDKSTGEVNMAARWYNPSTGSFLNKDSVSNPATPNTANANPFAYGDGDPLIGTDPSGHNFLNRPMMADVGSGPGPKSDEIAVQSPGSCATQICYQEITQRISVVQKVQDAIVDESYSDLERLCMHGSGALKCLQKHGHDWYSSALGQTIQATGGQFVEGGALASDLTYVQNVVAAQQAAAAQQKAAEQAQHRSWWQKAIGIATQVITTVASVAAVIAFPGSAPLIGALASMVNYSVDAALNGSFSVTGLIASGAVGLVSSYVGGASVGLAGRLTSEISSSLLSSAVEGVVVGTVTGGVSGFGNYAISCGQSCSLTGALVSTGTGALIGGVTGGVLAVGMSAVGNIASSLRSSGASAAGDATGTADTAMENSGGAASSDSGAPNVGAGGSSAAADASVSDPATSTGNASAAEGKGDPGNESSPAGKGCYSAPNSFTALTPVLMADGTTKPISQVKVGDQIANSVPGQSGVQVNTVTAIEVVQTDHDFVDVTVKPLAGASVSARSGADSSSVAASSAYEMRTSGAAGVVPIKSAVKRAAIGAAAVLATLGLATGALRSAQPSAALSSPAAALAKGSTASAPTRDAENGASRYRAGGEHGATILAAGGTITTTFLHPFYDETRTAFVQAQSLHVGDVLQTPTGNAVITEVHLYHADTVTYDLTIDGLHTFYVVAGNTPVLVHNCGDDPGAPNETDASLARDRAEQIQAMREQADPKAADGTTAVFGIFNKVTRQWSTRVGFNGEFTMPKEWLADGESFAPGAIGSHAEQNIIDSLSPDEVIGFGGTTRNICWNVCYNMLEGDGVEFGGVGYRRGWPDKSPYTLFWVKDWFN